jgi:prepilin-type N-terminal cleavage/methylation domain-containing protein
VIEAAPAGALLMSVPVRARLDSPSGFSLVETLVAVAILASGLLSLAQLFTVSAVASTRAREMSRAAILAAQKLEELRARAVVADLPTEDRVEYLDGTGSILSATPTARGAAFTRRWSMRPHPDLPGSITVITVRVTPGGLSTDDIERSASAGQAGEVVLLAMRTREE